MLTATTSVVGGNVGDKQTETYFAIAIMRKTDVNLSALERLNYSTLTH